MTVFAATSLLPTPATAPLHPEVRIYPELSHSQTPLLPIYKLPACTFDAGLAARQNISVPPPVANRVPPVVPDVPLVLARVLPILLHNGRRPGWLETPPQLDALDPNTIGLATALPIRLTINWVNPLPTNFAATARLVTLAHLQPGS